MNKNHIDILIAGSSEMVTKYKVLSACAVDVSEMVFFDNLVEHWLKVYKRAVVKSRLDKDT